MNRNKACPDSSRVISRERSRGGFTLIELLVVIAIIGILASIVIVGLNEARKRGRDARRISDLKAIQTALELYYEKNGNQYPEVTESQGQGYYCMSSFECWNNQGEKFFDALSPAYFQTMPQDPSLYLSDSPCTDGLTRTYVYWHNSQYNPNQYALITNLENTGLSNSNSVTSPFTGCLFGNYVIKGGKW